MLSRFSPPPFFAAVLRPPQGSRGRRFSGAILPCSAAGRRLTPILPQLQIGE
jgi:hypothetical protein